MAQIAMFPFHNSKKNLAMDVWFYLWHKYNFVGQQVEFCHLIWPKKILWHLPQKVHKEKVRERIGKVPNHLEK